MLIQQAPQGRGLIAHDDEHAHCCFSLLDRRFPSTLILQFVFLSFSSKLPSSFAPMKKILVFIIRAFASPLHALSLPSDDHFKVETLVEGLSDAMEITVLPTGEVLIAERTGALKWYSPESSEVKVVKKFDVSIKKEGRSRETGLLGITADPQFEKNGWIYTYYSPERQEEHRLSRFRFHEGELKDEKILLRVKQSREKGVCHEGGSLAFDRQGHLFLSTGDNTNPFKSNGYSPLDERRDHEHMNSQRTAADTSDLRGKILRIIPTPNGQYRIPEGNLFPKGKSKTRPEIFVMGCRNPWRISVDQRTSTLYWGDVGPDARETSDRGPNGYCEMNQASKAGNYGWPYFVGDNQPYSEYDFEKETLGRTFVASAPENHSRLNRGLEALPPAQEPLWFVRRSCYCAGPIYYYEDYETNQAQLPKELDGCLITYDWNNGRMQLTKLSSTGEMEWKEEWLATKKFIHPSDVEMGPDGAMYVLEYGSTWYDGTDGKLKKVTYSDEKLQENAAENIDPRLAGLPATHPGTVLLSEAICLSCHQTQVTSIGPRYQDVADRYRDNDDAVAILAGKILKGGAGAWGEVPMPPHPQYHEEQAKQMAEAILLLEPTGHEE